MKVILDTNIVLDVLLKRKAFYQASYEVVKSSIINDIDAVLPQDFIKTIKGD